MKNLALPTLFNMIYTPFQNSKVNLKHLTVSSRKDKYSLKSNYIKHDSINKSSVQKLHRYIFGILASENMVAYSKLLSIRIGYRILYMNYLRSMNIRYEFFIIYFNNIKHILDYYRHSQKLLSMT